MLITQDPSWQGKQWPGPFVRVIGPGSSADSDANAGWVVFEVLTPAIRNVALLQQILVKLWACHQLGFGPLLYSRDPMPDDRVQDLLKALGNAPNRVDLETDPTTGDLLWLTVGADLMENPLFGGFFRNLTHTTSMPPEFLADQMRRHLGAAPADGSLT